MLISFFGVIHSLGGFFVSDNLVNIKNVEKTMIYDYDLSPNEYSIRYFNDSYIFIEYITVSDIEKEKLKKENKLIPKEIVILKFDEFFKKQ